MMQQGNSSSSKANDSTIKDLNNSEEEKKEISINELKTTNDQ
jgi:hypothetical protein